MKTMEMHAGRRFLVRWVELVRRSAALVLVLAVLATAVAAALTITRIGINTSTTDMLSEELPFRRNSEALKQAFPQYTDTFILVIDAETADLAEDAATSLASALGAQPALYRDVYYPEGDAFFLQNGLLYLHLGELETLSDRLAEAQPLLSALHADPSLRGLAHLLREAIKDSEASASLAPALERIAASVEDFAVSRGEGGQAVRLSWRALISGEASGPEDKRRFILVQPVLDYGSLEPASRAIAAVRVLAREQGLGVEGHGARLRITGEPVMFQDELHSLRDGMGLAGLLSAILVITLLVIGLRSARLVGATLVTLVMGLVWTACFATLVIGELNLISVAFAVLFIGLSVDFGIHFVLRYREAVQANSASQDSGKALAEAAAGVGGALTLCAVAAAIGFFSFLPTSYRGVSELGLISGVGMFIALFANLTVLPAILALLPLKPGGPALHSPAGDLIQRYATRYPRAVIGGALVLGLAAAVLVPSAWFDDDPLNLRDSGSESVATLIELLDDARLEPYSASVLADDVAAGERLAQRLEKLPEVESVRTLGDLVPGDQDSKLAVIDEMSFFLTPLFQSQSASSLPGPEENRQAVIDLRARLKEAEGALAAGPLAAGAARLTAALDRLKLDEAELTDLEAALLGGLPGRLDALRTALEAAPITLDALPPHLRARYLTSDGQSRIDVIPREDLRDAAARRRFVDAVQQVAPAASGAPVIITEAGRAVVQAFGEAAAYAIVLIVMLLLVLLRSLRDTALVLAPLILAALLTVAAAVVLRIPFNFANVIVLPLLFGLGVAGGIHVVFRARSAATVDLVATSTPRAVLFSALTTIGSFCALALSSHQGTASMGLLLTIAITLTMLSTLVVLPALLASAPITADFAPDAKRRAFSPLRVGMLLLGLGLFAYIASQADLAEVWRRVVELGPWGALAVCAVYFGVFMIDTASWQLTFQSVGLNAVWLGRLWKVRMVGEALNLILPAASLGGEPVKAVLLKNAYDIDYREGGASVVIAKTVNLLALLVFAAVGLVLALRAGALPAPYDTLAGAGLGALAFGVAGFYLVQRWRAASRLARWLTRWRIGRPLERFLQEIAAVDDYFAHFYARRPGRFAGALALAFANWVFGAAEIYVIMWFLGLPMTIAEAWLVESVAQLVRAGAFFIPAGLGVSEAALVLVYDALTGRPALGFAVALIRRGRELLWVAWGLWLGWRFAPAQS